MRFPKTLAALTTLCATLAVSTALPLLAEDAPSPLQAFGALAVGEWSATGSHHVFEWGVGRKAVRSRSYFTSGKERTLVSEGFWYADPSGNGVRGLVVAVEMPMDLMEYHATVRGNAIVHELVTHGEMAGEFRESWQFAAGRYDWTLEQADHGTMRRLMGGTYEKAD